MGAGTRPLISRNIIRDCGRRGLCIDLNADAGWTLGADNVFTDCSADVVDQGL